MGNTLYAARTYLFPLITGFRSARSTESTATLMSGGFNINARWCLRVCVCVWGVKGEER